METFDPNSLCQRACKDCNWGDPNDILLDDDAGDFCDYCKQFICQD